jgi:predicted dehydrogenase
LGALATPVVRWGILGTGRMARDFALDLRRVPDAQLSAVGSRSPDRARAFAAVSGADRAYGSYEELVADSAVDVVYVATPNSQHRQNCLLALSAGKAVLCEKPFATSAREARDVVALARQQRLFCMEAMWTRFLPLVARAERLVSDGQIGEPLAFRADFGIAVKSRAGRLFSPDLGGGALLDLGVYLVAMARSFLGPPEEARGFARIGPTGVDEQVSILLRHPGERHSQLLASVLSETPGEALVLGTHGRLRIHAPFYRPHRISIDRVRAAPDPARPGRPLPATQSAWKAPLRRFFLRFENVLRPIARRPEIAVFEPIDGGGYQYQAEEVSRALRAGQLESPRMPLDETVAILELLDALRDEWRAGSAGDPL